MDAYLCQWPGGGGGGGAAPLRFASATNYYSNAAATQNLGTSGGLVRTDSYNSTAHTIGQDMTTMVLGMTMQFLKAANGVSNIGNALSIVAMSVTYNGVAVMVTSSGSQSFTIADTANWLSDPIASTAFGGAVKFTKGTQCTVKVHWMSTAAATDKFPMGRARNTDVGFFVDPTKVTITNDVGTTGTLSYSMANGGVNNTDAKFSGNQLPIFVLGYHSKPSVVFLGDSKTYGTGDTYPAINVVGLSRTLFSDPTLLTSVQCSGLNMGCPSGMAFETFTAFGSGVVANHEYWYTLANYAVVGYGTNRINSSEQTTMWGRLRANGITPIIQRSLTPRSQAVTSPVSVSALTTDGTTTTVTGTMADTSGLIEGQSYPISGATPTTYNGTFAIHIVNGTTFTYTAGSVPASNATGTLVLDDQWRTTQYQTPAAASGWAVGAAADTFEQFLRGTVSTDANFTYYQSTAERASATLNTSSYWLWGVNGTAKYMTSDGLHEGGVGAVGYEKSCCTAGSVTTQAGGTVSQSLRAYVGTLP